jgi:hypothetical protein
MRVPTLLCVLNKGALAGISIRYPRGCSMRDTRQRKVTNVDTEVDTLAIAR